jgi:hypothetical protein
VIADFRARVGGTRGWRGNMILTFLVENEEALNEYGDVETVDDCSWNLCKTTKEIEMIVEACGN